MNKNEILNKIYFDRSGYGSIINTYKEAKAINKNITLSNNLTFYKLHGLDRQYLRHELILVK